MASKRELKKDINFIIFEMVEESYDRMFRSEGKEMKYEEIIDELVELRSDLIKRVNARALKSKPLSKDHFSKIISDLKEKSSEIGEKLNKI